MSTSNYYSPGGLERAIARFVEYYNHCRYHESLENVTLALPSADASAQGKA